MTRGGVRCVAAFVAMVLLTDCAALRGGPANAPVDGEWNTTLTQARQEVLAMRFGVADHILSDFADRHAGTMEALDASYYRALFKLDPANATGTVRDAEALLDAYLAVSGPLPIRADATTLRRIATTLEHGNATATSSPSSTASSPASATDKARDEETQRLRDELAKANAELERIKRRLAQPKP
jgi:hypothetical protein